jgi:hypothetical protein
MGGPGTILGRGAGMRLERPVEGRCHVVTCLPRPRRVDSAPPTSTASRRTPLSEPATAWAVAGLTEPDRHTDVGEPEVALRDLRGNVTGE